MMRCHCCRGSGRVELTGEALATYRLLLAAGETHGAALAVPAGAAVLGGKKPEPSPKP